MASTPYPLPRSPRRSATMTGTGAATYGPFGEGWGVFDLADVAEPQRLTQLDSDTAHA